MKKTIFTILIFLLPTLLFAQWAKSIGGLERDEGRQLEIDGSGNVHVIGTFGGIFDADPNVGVFNLTTVGDQDIFFAKYDSEGSLLWANSIGSTSSLDEGYDITLDNDGNVYIIGAFANTVDFDPSIDEFNLTTTGSEDIFFAKYDSDGNFIWAKSIGSTDNTSLEEGGYIKIDGNGNIYIAGIFESTIDLDLGTGISLQTNNGGYDFFFAKYDSDGNFIWAKSIGGNSDDFNSNISFDASGNIYISGIFKETVNFDPGTGNAYLTSAGFHDIFFAKYDSDGNFIWVKSISGLKSLEVGGIKIENNGSVYLSGTISGSADFNPDPGSDNILTADGRDIFIAKYTTSGALIWANKIGGSADEASYTIALDAGNNVYITGYFEDVVDFNPGTGIANLASNGGADIYFAKYDSDGSFIWAKSIGDVISDDIGVDIDIDGIGNVYITGYYGGTSDFDPGTETTNLTSVGVSFDVFIAKYSSDGVLPVELTTFTATSANSADGSISVELNWETATEVNNYGFEVERQNQELSIKNQDTSTKLSAGWEKVAFVQGHGNSNSPKYYSYSDKSLNLSGKYLYKLKQIDIDGSYEYSDEVEVDLGLPSEFKLSQNYPNPFNPTTTISYSVPSVQTQNFVSVHLKIYDVLGKEIATLVNEQQSFGNYKVDFDGNRLSSGIYYYQLKAGKFIETKKMMLLK